MKRVLLASVFASIALVVFSQSSATDKGARMIGLGGNIMTDIYELEGLDESGTNTSIYLGSDYAKFVTDNVFAGAILEWEYSGSKFPSMGETNKSYHSRLYIGPKIGFTAGDPAGIAFSTFYAGFKGIMISNKEQSSFSIDGDDESKNSFTENDIFGGIGIIFPVKQHAGIRFEFEYHYFTGKEVTVKRSQFRMNIGFTGLFFTD